MTQEWLETEERTNDYRSLSESWLKAVFDSIFSGVVVVDEETHKIVDANPQALIAIGASREHVIGKVCHSFICPAEKGKCPISDLGQTVDKSERVLLRADGKRIPIFKTVRTMTLGDHRYLIESFMDISERKQMEEKIRASEERYKSLIELAPDVIMTFDIKGVVTSCNTAATRMSGYSKDELIGKHFSKIAALRARDIPKYLTILNSIVRGKVPKPFEVIWKDKNGAPHFGEVHYSLIKGKDKIVGFQAIMRDITERKQMEEKLRQYSEHLEELVQKRTEELLESEKRYSVLVEEASDGVAIIQEGKIVLINKRTSDISGYSKDELIGLSLEKLLSERYRQLVRERYARRLRGETFPATYEVEFIAKTGQRVPVEVSAKLTHYLGRPADLVIIRDIRERKRVEEERLRLEKLATVGELATMVGHDLRNPLQSIGNAAYVLNIELSQCARTHSISIPQKAVEMLQIISDSINYAEKMIRDLQDFSAAKTPILKKMNINALIEETLSKVKAPENVELRTELDHIPEIEVDKYQIKRVFLNLITNGIQAMESGGTLMVSTKKTEEFVEVSFKDTGVGIKKENIEKLFTPFFTTRAKGMGIGLSICKKFVENHGGTIQLESEVGKGTIVTVKLPIQKHRR